MLLAITLVIVVVLLFKNTLIDWLNVRWRNHPPGPVSLPLVGGAWALNPTHMPQQLVKMSGKFGGVISVRAGFQGQVVFLNSLPAIISVLRNKAAANRPNHPILQYLSSGGYGIMVAPYGKLWKTHNQLCHSAISLCLNSSLDGKIIKVLDTLCDRFAVTAGAEMYPHKDLYRTSFKFIGILLFGEEKSFEDEQLEKDIQTNETIIANLAVTSLLHLFPILLKIPNIWRTKIQQLLQDKDKAFMEELKRCYREKMTVNQTHPHPQEMDSSQSVFKVLVKEMIKKSSTFNKKQKICYHKDTEEFDDIYSFKHLQNTVWGLKLAGVDTTTSGMEWIVLLLAAFPAVQKKAKEEILTVLGSKPLQLADKHRLHYIEALLRECLRMGSLTSLCPPHVSEVDIELGGYTIPKGTPVISNIWAVHHDPNLWTHPNTLKPERFLDDNGHILPKRHFPGYIPFSRGIRPCIGSVVSQVFFFCFIVTILRRFDITLVGKPDLEGIMRFGMNPKPYKVIFTPT